MPSRSTTAKTSTAVMARTRAITPILRGEGPTAVYGELRERIVHGRLAPGTRLVESEIAIRLGVSRTPVRAALERLHQEGYIIGTEHTLLARATVAPLTNDDAREIYLIVAHIEGLAAREAAAKPKEVRTAMVKKMRRLNSQFRAAAEVRVPNSDRLHDLDDAFHHSYVYLGAGPRLRVLHDAVKPQAERYGRIYTSTLASAVGTSAAEHDAIITALDAGNADRAERAVQTNWENAAVRLATVINAIGERGTW
jgi:DNA-binding GntR family transcriptional regulator